MSRSLYRAIEEFDFQGFLEEYGVDVRERNGILVGICPLCHWHRESFNVRISNGLWICFQCEDEGGKGSGVSLVATVAGLSNREAIQRILDNFSFDVDDYDEEEEFEEPDVETMELPSNFRPLAGATEMAAKPYLKYLSNRGVSDLSIARYNIGYCGSGRSKEEQRWVGRVIVPVYHLSKIVSFVGRAISKQASLKVDTPTGNDQKSYLFNLDNIWGTERVVLTEGVFDALVIPEMGVATFGKAVTSTQLKWLKQSGCKELVFCWDNDAIDEATKSLASYLTAFQMFRVELPEGEDPSSLKRTNVLKYIRAAEPIDLMEIL